MKLFDLKIWDLEKEVFSGKASGVKLKAIDGEVMVLANHIPYINAVTEGAIEYILEDGRREKISSSSGVLKVERDAVYLLVQSRGHGRSSA